MNDTQCIFCGEIIPEGRQACPICEKRLIEKAREPIKIDAKTIQTGIVKSRNGGRWIDFNDDPTKIHDAAREAQYLLSFINEHTTSTTQLKMPDGEILISDWGYVEEGLKKLMEYWRKES